MDTYNNKTIRNAIVVHTSFNKFSGTFESLALDVDTLETIIQVRGRIKDTSINVLEALAICHTLEKCHELNLRKTIFNNNTVAIAWVTKQKFKSRYKSERIVKLIKEAEDFLRNNEKINNIAFWKPEWGHIAEFIEKIGIERFALCLV